jgi:hypothetical protein
MVRRMIVCMACFVVAACGGTQYVYAPQRPHIARDGEISTRVPVPPNGEVRIASQGVRRISSSEGAQVDALLVRMTVTNAGERPWSIDTRAQLMQLPTGFRARPLLVRSAGAVGPVLDVGCGDRRIVDLYSVLPPAGLASLPSFDLLWQIHAGDRVVSRRTELQRVRVEQFVDGTPGREAAVQWGYYPDRPIVVLPDSPALISQRQLRPDELR